MQRSVNMPGVSMSKLDKIKAGTKTKTQIGGVSENKKIVHGKEGKFHITEKEKKFEESGVARKKRNYVMYESKLGTEKEQNLQKIDAPKPKPKPKPAPKPRTEEKIVIKKKKKEYLDNYQYHETKDIKDNNPNRVSIVTHQRLGDIIGGSYEETSTQRYTMTDSGTGSRVYSQSSTRSAVKRDAKGAPTSFRSNTVSRTVPAQSRALRSEVKQFSSSSRSGPRSLPGQTVTSSRTTTTRVSSRTTSGPGAIKTSTRTFSAGRRH